MRYSMLVYLVNMGKTLLEAAQYLRTAADCSLQADLLENGGQIIQLIRAELERHSGDLRTSLPLEQLRDIERLWSEADFSSELEHDLNQFTGCLPENVSYQVRAVFFAELGEKWDAMESVYKYMHSDSRFDIVVVRTPISRVIERNGVREQETIYKDFLTPMGVPSLGYDQYSLEEDCPDLAFTSQPYESCSPEQFWPQNIAEYTRLVYLPYYLPDRVTAVSVNSLALFPVYRFAWKVVCPTEKQYKFYCRHAKNKGANALLTGAPKTDPFVSLRKNPPSIPTGWECLRDKTVFLWNSWYDFSGSSCRYADALLDWFEGHEDCALIWRPHPMTDTVTKFYYPAQYPVYQSMLQRAHAAENVVIDQETSCAAAFCASAALLSDYSSLLPQYLLLDKPALWINCAKIQFTGEEFIDSHWMEQAANVEEIFAFMERICGGRDRNAMLRTEIRRRDLALADGNCGKRVCASIWKAMHQEDFSIHT